MSAVRPVLALVWLAAPAAATWYEAYDRAEQAIDAESWSEAVQHLNAALEEQPSSSSRARTYGMRFIEYFPYLKLGVAYYHLGQADAALQAFETEERQGEIARSSEARTLLQSYRDRIVEDRAAEAVERQRRSADLVSNNLAAAQRLEAEARLEDALAAVARVLALAPDHSEAQAAQARLLKAVAERRRLREGEARRSKLVADGEAHLEAGELRRAAASFGEALELHEDAEVRSLLEEARERLRAEIASVQKEAERRDLMTLGLRRAAELESAGDLMEALTELQAVLAFDPRNAAARALQDRILRTQAAAERSATRGATIRRLLVEAEGLLASGSHERALQTAHRVLALEPAHGEALRMITRAYSALSESLLAADAAAPAILLDDDRPEGAPHRLVRSPRHELRGAVYDGTPVEVRVLADGRPVGEATLSTRELRGVWITEFRWQHDLPRGVSTFEVVAVDGDGETAAVGYSVDYVVPFVRSGWFPASVGAGLAAIALGFVAVRARRQQKLLRDRFNPYVAGAPILAQERFFGRQQLLDYVLRRVCNNSVMLYGERRIGKTSFQHRLKRCLTTLEDPHHTFFPVYVDLQGTPQERFFATLAAEVFHELAPKLDGVQPSAVLAGASYGYRDFVKDIHRVLKGLKERSRKKVKLVLLIDEVDELNEYDPRINQRLRSVFMRAFADSLVAVVSGVAIKKHWEREGSPWYNFFQEIEVKPLDPEEARSLIEAPVRGVFRFADGAADEIIRRTGSKPYLIQRLCSSLVDRLHEERRRTITLGDVEAACQVEGL